MVKVLFLPSLVLFAIPGQLVTPDAARAGSESRITISTDSSLALMRNVYATIRFTAKGNPEANLPVLYHFTQTGNPPPGMIFESYPCNKPNREVCPSVASADTIFLDGTPTSAGSYTVTINVRDAKGNESSQNFTITVSERN